MLRGRGTCIVIAYIVMAYIVTAYMVMAKVAAVMLEDTLTFT